MNRVYNMDFGWKFSLLKSKKEVLDSHKEMYLCVKAGKIGGEVSKTFDDSEWQEIDLPHDYVMASEIKEENGFRDCLKRSAAWYRKSFILDKSFKDKQIAVCFEGIALHAEIYLNGSLIHRSFSAYTEHFIDITDRVYVGGKSNTLVVKTDASTEFAEMWTYEGGGIYRHVKLYAKNKSAHIAHNGVFAYARLKQDKNLWDFQVETEVENTSYEDTRCLLKVALIDKGKTVRELTSEPITVSPFCKETVKTGCDLFDPAVWDIDNPYLYDVVVSVIVNGETVDEEKIPIGFRNYCFDSEKGFFLNGRRVKLKGVCCHQDHGGVGVAIPDALQYERVRIIKEMGANMYRSAHHNPSREILDACDRLGVLVIDENRHFESSEENLKYIEITVKRDRNHPSVFMYCLFNEEPLQNTSEGRNIYKRLKLEVKKYDGTRLFTGAMHGNFDGAGEEMDVCGINYGYGYLDNLHRQRPNVCIIGTENNSQISTRGAYCTDRNQAHVISSYDDECVPWGNTVKGNWEFVRERDYMSGCSVWTAFDYHGEPIMPWPTVNSEYGLMDICGFPKGVYYVCKSCYSEKPMIKILPHWNWSVGDTVRVVAVSNCQETELFLNGRSLGRKNSDCCNPNEWEIVFENGTLEAKGYNEGALVATDTVKTALTPRKVKISANKCVFENVGNDTIILNCSVIDENGEENPVADNKLSFEIIGDAELLGVGNGDPNSHEKETIPERKLYYGKCQAIIRVKRFAKNVEIVVSGENLESVAFSPKIINVENGLFIESAKNNYITSFDVTPSSTEYIDPLMPIDKDDMNTLQPMEIDENTFQTDYRSGWKLYRTFMTLPKSFREKNAEREFCLYFDDVKVNKMFVFVDGKEIFKTDITHRYTEGSIACEFSGIENSVVELRVLVHINIESKDGAGFRKSIRMI